MMENCICETPLLFPADPKVPGLSLLRTGGCQCPSPTQSSPVPPELSSTRGFSQQQLCGEQPVFRGDTGMHTFNVITLQCNGLNLCLYHKMRNIFWMDFLSGTCSYVYIYIIDKPNASTILKLNSTLYSRSRSHLRSSNSSKT